MWEPKCDHREHDEVVCTAIEIKCLECGQIKKKIYLEKVLIGRDKICLDA